MLLACELPGQIYPSTATSSFKTPKKATLKHNNFIKQWLTSQQLHLSFISSQLAGVLFLCDFSGRTGCNCIFVASVLSEFLRLKSYITGQQTQAQKRHQMEFFLSEAFWTGHSGNTLV